MSPNDQLDMAEEGAACMNESRPPREPKREKYKRRCIKGVSLLKVCGVAIVGLLTALIYLVAETKVGVELADRLLYGAASYALNESRTLARASLPVPDGLMLLAQLLSNLTACN